MAKAAQIHRVPIDSPDSYPDNPRRGDIAAIRESYRYNGQFKPIVVWKSRNIILDGNHTREAMELEGATEIDVVYAEDLLGHELDDDQAAHIVLVANRTNDLATYDTELLAKVLKTIESPVGTGYSVQDYNILVEAIERSTPAAVVADIIRPAPAVIDESGNLDATPLGQEPIVVDDEEFVASTVESTNEEDAPDVLRDASEQLMGAFDLKPDMIFERVGEFHFPPLRKDLLVQPNEVPINLIAWAGSATKDWPDKDQWWLYNYGIDSTSGMHDISKCIVSFYCWDHYFESWWDFPDRFTTKVLNSGIKMMVMPDYTMHTDNPRLMNMYNLYRNLWLARYFQEAGLKVIPNVHWAYKDWDLYQRFVLPSVDQAPVISIQLQTFADDLTDQDKQDHIRRYIDAAVQSTGCELLILYCGKRALEWIETEPPFGCDTRIIKNRLIALGDSQKRAKKATI